jgi:cytochrome c553
MYPFSWKPLTLGIGALLPVVGMTGLVGAQQTPKPKSAAAPSPKTVRKPPVSVPAETIPPEQVAFFETKIRPVLVKNCYSCHSEKAGMGGLYLDSRESIRRGGDTGPAIVPGDPAKSLLLRAISHQGRLRMPPSGKLSDDVITDFTTWVKMGAPDPRLSVAATPVTRVIDIAKGKRFWSFQPPRKPAVPTTLKNRTWARSDLDRFVLEKLEAKGLTPAKDADRRTLIRRVYYDLTGLPPTPAEVNAFLADTSPDAYAKVVDRLLASPEYGRRWGRHWLDVARYAESSGKERNIAYPHAWRYRDWVIDAFNRDKPYDRFLKEQLAGDLLPADTERQRAEQVIATGFLAIGPKSHGTRSAKQFQMDVADEQIDAMSQGMLGLTIACARCHDHKFDPIPTKDYYALAGIFTSTETRFGGPRFQAIQQSTPLIELPNIPELPVAANVYSPSEVARLREQLTRLQEERQNLLREARAANDPRRAAVNPNFIRISAQIASFFG